jgi:hypothetical protein
MKKPFHYSFLCWVVIAASASVLVGCGESQSGQANNGPAPVALPGSAAPQESVETSPNIDSNKVDMSEQSCNYDQYVGQKPSPEIIAAIKATGMETVEVVGELDAVTMDYSETRVRLITDTQTGLIKMVTCG